MEFNTLNIKQKFTNGSAWDYKKVKKMFQLGIIHLVLSLSCHFFILYSRTLPELGSTWCLGAGLNLGPRVLRENRTAGPSNRT